MYLPGWITTRCRVAAAVAVTAVASPLMLQAQAGRQRPTTFLDMQMMRQAGDKACALCFVLTVNVSSRRAFSSASAAFAVTK